MLPLELLISCLVGKYCDMNFWYRSSLEIIYLMYWIYVSFFSLWMIHTVMEFTYYKEMNNFPIVKKMIHIFNKWNHYYSQGQVFVIIFPLFVNILSTYLLYISIFMKESKWQFLHETLSSTICIGLPVQSHLVIIPRALKLEQGIDFPNSLKLNRSC